MKTPFEHPPEERFAWRIHMDWCLDFALMLAIVGTLLHPWWLALPMVCLVLLWAGVMSL